MLLFNKATDKTGSPQELLDTIDFIKNESALNRIPKKERPAVNFAIKKSTGNTRRHSDIQQFTGLYVFDLDQYPDPNLLELEQELKKQPDSTVDAVEGLLTDELTKAEGFTLLSRSASNKAFYTVFYGPTANTVDEYKHYHKCFIQWLSDESDTFNFLYSESQDDPARLRYLNYHPDAQYKTSGPKHFAKPKPEPKPTPSAVATGHNTPNDAAYFIERDTLVDILAYKDSAGNLVNDPHDWLELFAGVAAIRLWDCSTDGFAIAFNWMKLNAKQKSSGRPCRVSMNEKAFKEQVWDPAGREYTGKPRTIATFIRRALDVGYTFPPKIDSDLAGLKKFRNRYVFAADHTKQHLKLTGAYPSVRDRYDRGAMQRICAKHFGKPLDEIGDFVNNLHEILTYADKPHYDPRQPPGETITDYNGDRSYNVYRPSLIEPSDSVEDTERLWNHIKKLIPDDNDRNYVMNIATNMFVNPGKKIPAMIIFQSTNKGWGKSSFVKLMQNCFGNRNHAVNVRPSDWENKFNALLKSALMCFSEEVKFSPAAMANLKEAVANQTITVEMKGQDQVTTDFFAQCWATTNEKCPFDTADVQENKFFLIDVDTIFTGAKEMTAYYDSGNPPMGAWLQTQDAAAAMLALCYEWQNTDTFKQGDWTGRPPMSKAYRAMIHNEVKGYSELSDIIAGNVDISDRRIVIIEDKIIAVRDDLLFLLAKLDIHFDAKTDHNEYYRLFQFFGVTNKDRWTQRNTNIKRHAPIIWHRSIDRSDAFALLENKSAEMQPPSEMDSLRRFMKN